MHAFFEEFVEDIDFATRNGGQGGIVEKCEKKVNVVVQ